jgi:hypothetical protein
LLLKIGKLRGPAIKEKRQLINSRLNICKLTDSTLNLAIDLSDMSKWLQTETPQKHANKCYVTYSETKM